MKSQVIRLFARAAGSSRSLSRSASRQGEAHDRRRETVTSRPFSQTGRGPWHLLRTSKCKDRAYEHEVRPGAATRAFRLSTRSRRDASVILISPPRRVQYESRTLLQVRLARADPSPQFSLPQRRISRRG
ncbi:hypothetical protein OH76DRAFT_738554 [Lentinus brumalis]|uniref:Uncharacterized protein n=1 Tax=Lentinus brumalis TaxID=2498619 RepID=A0A371DS88_9APHY|nr:hypothetical protein OH76DRAFT_738554 [Polyporus brumalis]